MITENVYQIIFSAGVVLLLILLINNFVFYRSNTINVEPGDRILLYTDGATEAHNPKGELYGEDRLIEVFKENIDNSEEQTIDAIYDSIEKFADGTAQFEDITMVVLTVK